MRVARQHGRLIVIKLLCCTIQVDYPVGISCLPTWNAHQLNAVDQSQWDRALRAPDLTGCTNRYRHLIFEVNLGFSF